MNHPRLIGLVGLRRSGKDTAAEALLQDGYANLKFATPLKDMLRAFLNYVMSGHSDSIERLIEGDRKENTTSMFCGKSTRYAMQSLGTEWGRNLIHPDIWVRACMARASAFPKVVISDVRFANEVEAVRNAGGKVIRIFRPDMGPIDSHVSESLVLSLPVDLEIINDKSIGALHDAVRRAESILFN